MVTPSFGGTFALPAEPRCFPRSSTTPNSNNFSGLRAKYDWIIRTVLDYNYPEPASAKPQSNMKAGKGPAVD